MCKCENQRREKNGDEGEERKVFEGDPIENSSIFVFPSTMAPALSNRSVTVES
jgi:hypothetical protein